MKYLLNLLFIIPFLSFSQDYYWKNSENTDYFYLAKEVDPVNLTIGGVKDTKGYNGNLLAGYKNEWFQLEGFYEIYPNIEYKSFGMNLYYIHNNIRKFRQGAGIQISAIERPTKMCASLGLNGLLEYHFGRVAIRARGELKYRSDLKEGVYYYGGNGDSLIKPSGYVGVLIKI